MDHQYGDSHDTGNRQVWCSVREAAHVLGTSESTIRRRIKAQILTAEHNGKQWHVLLPSQLFQKQTTETSSPHEVELLQEEAPSHTVLTTDIDHTRPRPKVYATDHPPLSERTVGSDDAPPATGIPEEQPIQSGIIDFQVRRHYASTATDEHEPYVGEAHMSHVNSQQEVQPRPTTPTTSQRTQRNSRSRWTRDLPLALILGLMLLSLVDYVLKGDAIPLLADRSVPANQQSSPTRIAEGSPPASQTRASPAVLAVGSAEPRVTPTPNSLQAIAVSSPAPSATAQVLPYIGSQPEATALPSSPTALATTQVVTPTVLATTTPIRSADDVLQQVVAAESALRSGEFEGTIDYGTGPSASIHVRFDYGNAEAAPRLHMQTTYQSATGSQTRNLIMIGDQSWERQGNGTWVTSAGQEAIWGQMQTYLPQADVATNLKLDTEGGAMLLHWYDAGRDTDVTLQTDQQTGTPQLMREVMHPTQAQLTVTYIGWNTPVTIEPPNVP